MNKLILFFVLVIPSIALGQAGTTAVTAQIKDTNGALYSNCQWSVIFVGENTTPGAGPYAPAAYLNGQQGTCDSFGNFSINLGDNINTITPTPSQWSFSICSATGYLGGPFCKTNVLVTITGATQNLTSTFTPLMPLLPTSGTGGPLLFAGIPTGACTSPQTAVNTLTGDFYTCAGGAWLKIGPSASAGNPGGSPFSVQTNVGGVSFGGVPLGVDQFIVGTTGAAVARSDSVYDARAYGLAQNGSTDDTTALGNVLNTIGSNNATVMFTGPTSLESVTFPPNVKVKFEQTGQLKPISSSTPLGGAGFVQGSGASNVNTLTSSCSVTLNGTVAGNTIIFLENHFFTAATIAFGSVTDSQGGHYTNLVQQGFNFSSVNSGWARANIAGGTITVTVPYKDNVNAPVNVANGCIAWEISGMGPVVAAESSATAPEGSSNKLVMTAGAITTTAGALVIGFGGQTYLNQASCTPAAGFTQPAGSAGFISGGSQPSTGYGQNLCATYKLVSPGGSQTPTSTITNDPGNIPLNKYWAYAAVSVIPSSSVINIQGPIDAPPQQIFTNSLAGQGTIDLSGNTVIDKVFPEWWGASSSATAATNTPALQAAIIGAFGSNRINGSQANVYNRELHFSGLYNINGTLSANHMNGFRWTCSQRFACGLNQTATNTSILNTTTGGTYGSFENFLWSTNASQDLAHPLVDLNYTGAGGPDLVTQFIDFPFNTFNGNNLASIGLRIAAAGGGGQGSNIYFYDNEASSFTEAAYMIGNGSGCASTALATNAIAIEWFGGDMQFNNAYGIEWFGGGQIKVDGTTFEDGFGAATNVGIQTGYDICGQTAAAGETFTVDNVRSESLYMLGGSGPYHVRNSYNADQAAVPAPTNGVLLGETIQGSLVAGHGVYQTVTVAGTWTGVGAVAAPILATSGTGTTLVNTNQSVAGTNTVGLFVVGETVTQAVTGSTGTILNVPISIGTITGSVTTGTIGTNHTLTQATTGVTCKSTNAPTGSGSLTVKNCSGAPDNSHIYTDGTTGGTYTPTSTPTFGVASPVMVITTATGAPDNSHVWTGGTSAATLTPTTVPTATSALTVNAWIGWYLTLLGGAANTGANQYCVITANTATAFTCAGGWVTDFPDAVTIANPDSTSIYIVEPQWGTQVTNGSATWAAITKKVGAYQSAQNVFVPGLQIQLGQNPIYRGFQVTRADWMGTADADNTFIYNGIDGVMAGAPGATPGSGEGTLGGSLLMRRQKFTRNAITETAYPLQTVKGTAVDHWQAGLTGGGTATVDIYAGGDPNTGTKNGRYFIENNSSGTPRFTYFNADASTTLPGPVSASSYTSTAANGGLSGTEGTGALVPAGGSLDVMWPDSTAHRWLMNNNNGGNQNVIGSQDFQAVYNHSGTQQTTPHIVQDSCTLGTDCGVTLTGAAVYTNSTSYTCTCADDTAIAACKVAQTSGSAFTITGTGTDSIRYVCAGN